MHNPSQPQLLHRIPVPRILRETGGGFLSGLLLAGTYVGTMTSPLPIAIAANLNNAADDDEYRAAMREGLHTFDMLRERYGIAPEYGLWSMVASDEENRPRR